jgi:hypothetical protein
LLRDKLDAPILCTPSGKEAQTTALTLKETRPQCIQRLTGLASEQKPRINWVDWQTESDKDNPRQQAFIRIYETNYWGGALGSGTGSELGFSVPVRCYLSQLIVAYNIKTILDAPCGDLWWMSHFLEEHPQVNYIGVDIVPALVRHHKSVYQGKSNWEFHLGDLTDTQLFSKIKNSSPLWKDNVLILTRHAIEHNTVPDQVTIFRNLHNSGAAYLLTTNHPETCSQPTTTESGGFSRTNFMLAPVKLPKPVEYLHESEVAYMGLWRLPLVGWKPDQV